MIQNRNIYFINNLFKHISNRVGLKQSIVLLFFVFLGMPSIFAQLNITQANAILDPEALVETIFLGDGVDVTNISYDGDNQAVGFFVDGQNDIGIERGLVISSGSVTAANQTEMDFASTQTSGPQGDSDLDPIANSNLPVMDVSRYEITFIPTADTLRFRYVFTSEEYPGFNCSSFNDIFGFFISGPNPDGGDYNGKNIALVPDPLDPSGETFLDIPVTIANVHGETSPQCQGSFEQYYNLNTGSQFLSYGAYLDVFTAQALVIPCQEYTIKLAIADVGDDIYDSSVFLEAKSFGTGSLEVNIETVSLDGSVAEGCNPGVIVISLDNPVEEDLVIDAKIIDCDDSATFGVDYTGLPETFVIPAGQSRVEYEVIGIQDGIIEGTEYICFDIQRDICNRDTVRIGIAESPLDQVFIPNDTMICEAQTVFLNSDLPQDFVLPPSPNFSFSGNVNITQELDPNNFDLNVSGVAPSYLTQGMIKSICIDTIEHIFLTDMDIFLVTPGGQFMELSTDNGAKPMNGSDIDYMINTCFTPFASTEIENGNNLSGPIFDANPTYNGDFLPEGIWNDLYGENNPSNGVYTLLIIDDETGATARFTGWSICFNPLYNLTYEWSSDVHGDICTNCEDFPVEVNEPTTFYLTVTDSYGCQFIDSFFVETVGLLSEVENMVCDSTAPTYIRVKWDAEALATGYEISIPGVIDPAIDIGNVTEWAIPGLDPITDYPITITTLGGPCGGKSTTIVCTTDNCEVDPLVIEDIQGITCFGDTDGILDVVITGNSPPFQYEFQSTNDPTGSFTNLVAGIDTLFITDNTDCTSKFVIEIESPNILNIDFENKSEISCFNEEDGRVLADPFGGTMPYSFEWSNGELIAQANMLVEGWNVVTVADFNGCILIDSILFVNPPELQASHLVQDATCFGIADGVGIINPSGGTINNLDDYTFEWGDPLNQTTQQAENLPAGTYIVTVSDLNACTTTEEVVITSPTELITNVVGTDVSCFNTTDGQGLVNVMGGSGPFGFLWDNSEVTNPAINLNAGKHYVTITDGACEKIDSITIGAPDAIEVMFSNTDVTCFDGDDGIVSWSVIGGTGMITVTDANGIVVNSPIMSLDTATYCFKFTDSEGCALDTCVFIDQPLEILISEVIVTESCFNSNDASIDISMTNGVEPFTFEWAGPGTFTSNFEDLTDLNSGIYLVTVTDFEGCTAIATFDLDEPSEIVIDAEVFNIPCKGEETGIIQITPLGGTMPFTYTWVGPNGFTSNEEDLIDVFAGTYTLIFEDDQGCTTQKTYEIIEPSVGVTSGISGDDEVCFGENNGVASVSPFGGIMPYDITWSNGSKFANLNGLSPGIYFVTIVDGSLCSIVDTVEIIERPEIIVNAEQTTSSCFESLDGSAMVTSITVNGQTQDLDDYEYLWNSFPLQMTSEAISLKGGQDYLVVVTDNLGCTAQAQVIVETPEPVTATLEMVDSINCALGDDGSIIIQGRGGNAPFEYQWGQDANFQIGAAAKNLKAGSYDVTVTDINGCTGVEIFEIQDPFPISLNFRVFDVLCFGEEDGEVELITNGGTTPYNFNWSTGDQVDEILNLETGQYNVTVTDANDCVVVDSVVVEQPLEPLTLDVNTLNITCADGQDGRIIIEADGGSGNYIYSLDNFIYNGSIEQIGLSEGTYTAYVKDANGCIDSIDNIDIFSPAPLELDLGPDVYLSFGQTYQFDPQITNFQNPMIFEWRSPDTDLLTCTDCQTPFFDAIRQASYRLVVEDGRGCIVEDFINLYIENGDAVFVPTGFTPNGDFNNDLLNVYGLEGIEINAFRVFDRWGEVMFENQDFLVNDETVGWDGMFRGEEMPPGVYTWVVEAEFTNGFKQVYAGNTTLIK